MTTDAFRACVEEVAADDRVDAVLAVAVPTAFSDLSAAVAEAVVSKPLAVALLDRAESVRRLKRLPVARPPSSPPAATGPAGGPPAADPATAGQAAAIIDVAAAAVTGVPCYADPEGAARALGHAARYQAWRVRQGGTVPELSGLRMADARDLVTGFLAGFAKAAGCRKPARRSWCPAMASRWWPPLRRPASGSGRGRRRAARRPRRAQGGG